MNIKSTFAKNNIIVILIVISKINQGIAKENVFWNGLMMMNYIIVVKIKFIDVMKFVT
jgi:hypothetical protein